MAEHDDLSDEELVRRHLDGDAAALAVLSHRLRARLEARVRRRLSPGLRRKVAASDILQEAYIAALPRLPDFEDRGDGSFGRWFQTIVEARIADAVRRHMDTAKRTVRREVSKAARPATSVFENAEPSPSQVVQARELKQALRGAFAGLPEPFRTVIVLLQHERLPLTEAARRMGRSPGAVKKLYGRALARLEEDAGLAARRHGGRRRPTR